MRLNETSSMPFKRTAWPALRYRRSFPITGHEQLPRRPIITISNQSPESNGPIFIERPNFTDPIHFCHSSYRDHRCSCDNLHRALAIGLMIAHQEGDVELRTSVSGRSNASLRSSPTPSCSSSSHFHIVRRSPA